VRIKENENGEKSIIIENVDAPDFNTVNFLPSFYNNEVDITPLVFKKYSLMHRVRDALMERVLGTAWEVFIEALALIIVLPVIIGILILTLSPVFYFLVRIFQ
jgi:hypothetical protein